MVQRRSVFASEELAARIERADADLMVGCVAPIAGLPETASNFAIPLGSGFATFGGAESPFTKIAGVGFGDLPGPDVLADAEQRVLDAGGTVQFELSALANPELAEHLTRRGYCLVSFENVLGRAIDAELATGSSTSAGITVQPATDRMAEWMDVVLRGSLAPDTIGVAQHESFPRDELQRAEEALIRAGSQPYLALCNGVPAGGGGLRLADGIAQLTGAATTPEFRRRGVQSALLEARLRDASRAGCDLAVVTTQPGSVSQANMQKFGFDLLYTRAVLVLAQARA